MILPHLNYCLLSWGSNFNCRNKVFEQYQVQAVSLTLNYFEHNVQKVDYVNKYKFLTFYYTAIHTNMMLIVVYFSKSSPNCAQSVCKYYVR